MMLKITVLSIFAALVGITIWILAARNRVTAQPWQSPDRASAQKATGTYLGLRNQVLNRASNKTQSPEGTQPTDVLAILMDLYVGEHIVTVVAFQDGTTSIYISQGGGLLGGGQAFESVRKAGQNFISTAHKFQPLMHITKDFPLPQKEETSFML